jgi:acyl transferase domain-containing protein
MSEAAQHASTDVAIIGMSGRFPGARTLAEFWDNLRNGRESISRFTREEIVDAGVDPAVLSHAGYVNAGGVLEDIELFDAGLFGLSAREAEITDPQHRMFLECAWEALEDAGYDSTTYAGLIGVFGGVSMSRYAFNLYSNPEVMAAVGPLQVLLGTDKDHLTTRVAYRLNLKGPALTVQTACSTSLVAVGTAYQSLLDFQCDMALAGGVTISLPQKSGYFYQPGGISSPDGHCRAFDAEALGTVGGNGAGVVLLKRYEDAIADGDSVHAVIKAVALNNDGSAKVGYTAPSIEGQATVIATAQAMAGVHPDTIAYVEAHGTGTPLGDPIEIAALSQVFRASTHRVGFCALGSLKTNVGHLDCAAGIAGLIKVVLALKYRELPPSLHFRRPNPKADLARSPFYVNATLQPWSSTTKPRRAAVSSFGIGGTNAHAILEEAPADAPRPKAGSWAPLPLSARSREALEQVVERLTDFLASEPDAHWPDVAYTCAVGRRSFPHRIAVVAHTAEEGRQALTSAVRPRSRIAIESADKVVFLFPGQGSQHAQMGRGLLDLAVFQEQVERCAGILHPHLGLDLKRVIYPEELTNSIELDQTALTQPALFVLEYALARTLMTWGIRPHAMVGHSIGEFVAACLAGVFAVEDALSMVAARGRLMQEMPAGSMMAVSMTELEVASVLGAGLDLAAVNGPSQCVVSGYTEAIADLEMRLVRERVPCARLKTSHAFHSRMMSPAAQAFTRIVARHPLHSPTIPFISSVTGDWISSRMATDPEYWARQLRQPVRFAAGLERATKGPAGAVLEVGPGVSLSTLARQHPARGTDQVVISTMRHPKDARDDRVTLLDAVGQLWTAGTPIDWSAFFVGQPRRRLHLPTYPFERQRYWIEARRMGDSSMPVERAGTPRDPQRWLYAPSWRPKTRQTSTPAQVQSPRWLIFADDVGVGDAAAAVLRTRSCSVTVVTPGSTLRQAGADSYEIDPGSADDYLTLLAQLEQADCFPQRILHLWTVTDPADGVALAADGTRIAELGFFSLLSLAQAVGRHPVSGSLPIIVGSNTLHAVRNDDAVMPEKALVIGPVRVMPQEYPHLRCRSVDIALPASGDVDALNELAAALIAEAEDAEPDALVAYREQRLAQAVEPLPPRSPDEADHIQLRDHGVYLVTGGFGGIGLTLAEHLVRQVSARLVLVGRTPMPDRAEWDSVLRNRAPNDRLCRCIEAVRRLETLGSEVLVAVADAGNLAEMQQVVVDARARFGSIHGVIHSAGVAGGGMLQRKTWDAATRVLSPKIGGVHVLETLFDGHHLDFLVLCSSLSALFGGFGQIDYCAANAFLDAFAHSARARRVARKTISVNWDTWQEVGMAVDTPVPPELAAAREESLKAGLTNAEGIQVFTEVLSRAAPQVVICTRDLQMRVSAARPADPGRPVSTPAPAAVAHPRPALDTQYRAPAHEVESVVAAVWEEMLGVSPVGVDDDFFALGGHSLLAIQVLSRLREAFQLDIAVHVLFDNPTVATLAAHIQQELETSGKGTEHLTQIMKFVEQLSDEEVRKMLAADNVDQRRGA